MGVKFRDPGRAAGRQKRRGLFVAAKLGARYADRSDRSGAGYRTDETATLCFLSTAMERQVGKSLRPERRAMTLPARKWFDVRSIFCWIWSLEQTI